MYIIIIFQQSMMKCINQWENPVQKHFSVQFHPFTCKNVNYAKYSIFLMFTIQCLNVSLLKISLFHLKTIKLTPPLRLKQVHITSIHNRMHILKQNSSILLCHIPECCFLEPPSICKTRTQTENLQQEVTSIHRCNTTLPHRSTKTSIQFPSMS